MSCLELELFHPLEETPLTCSSTTLRVREVSSIVQLLVQVVSIYVQMHCKRHRALKTQTILKSILNES